MRTNVPHSSFHLVLVLCFIFLLSSIAMPQTIKGYYSHKLEDTKVGELLRKLEGNKISEIPKIFFGDIYNQKLPDLIFFIDRRQSDTDEGKKKKEDSAVNIKLIKRNKGDNLFGERFIYVMVFVAENKSEKLLWKRALKQNEV